MTIRLIPPNLVNQIAAGEVLERPAAAVKELVENSLDAGATAIEVVAYDGGRSFLSVTDNGSGMSKEELELAIQRHATSKLPSSDLQDIQFLGFRGEAIPSIGAVSRLQITSRTKESENAWSISVTGGETTSPQPAALNSGTRIEVRDIFYATPARLKFLKSAQTEIGHIEDAIQRLAMAYPEVSFTLYDEKRKRLNLPATQGLGESPLLSRLNEILGKEFSANSIPVNAERDGAVLSGFTSIPTYNRGNSLQQFLFVNGRPVKDKLINGAVRAAYQGLLASDRYPVVALFLTLPFHDVDVNVHPAKIEVRFKDSGSIRGLIVGALKNALAEIGHKSSTTSGIGALGSANVYSGLPSQAPAPATKEKQNTYTYQSYGFRSSPSGFAKSFAASAPLGLSESYSAAPAPEVESKLEDTDFPPLGLARAQLHETYIISQTKDGIIIVDQHAAHERLTYEKIRSEEGNSSQLLLSPEVINLTDSEISNILSYQEDLAKTGLMIEEFGSGAIVVRAVPAILGNPDVNTLIRDLLDTIADFSGIMSLEEKIKNICASMACHGSVRSGRRLNGAEMNALLRQMEAFPNSGECIHGRPTYIELKLKDIERLFGRR